MQKDFVLVRIISLVCFLIAFIVLLIQQYSNNTVPYIPHILIIFALLWCYAMADKNNSDENYNSNILFPFILTLTPIFLTVIVIFLVTPMVEKYNEKNKIRIVQLGEPPEIRPEGNTLGIIQNYNLAIFVIISVQLLFITLNVIIPKDNKIKVIQPLLSPVLLSLSATVIFLCCILRKKGKSGFADG